MTFSLGRRPAGTAAAVPPAAGEFESLGSVFLARLQSERVHLATLSAALARADENPEAIFHDLHSRARRLSGTAGIFEAADIAAAAHALEQAAAAAVHSHSDNANPHVWGAMLALMSRLPRVETD
jgi:HPt (histidine-containing phosphotransfer) domain-containing protein